MSELPTEANRANYRLLDKAQANALALQEVDNGKERGDKEKGDGRGEATANAGPKLTPGDELEAVVRGGEAEQMQLQGSRSRQKEPDAPDAGAGFLLAVAAHGKSDPQQDGAALTQVQDTQASAPEMNKDEITKPSPDHQGRAQLEAFGQPGGGLGNASSREAEQAKSDSADKMATFGRPTPGAAQDPEIEPSAPAPTRKIKGPGLGF